MSESIRVDTTDLISGAIVVGDVGHGVLGSQIATEGTDGPGYLYNAISLPADADKEIRGLITRWPSGALQVWEDSSFVYVGSADYALYQLFVDGSASTTDIGYGPGIGRVNLGVVNATAPGTTVVVTGTLIPGAATGGGTAQGALITLTTSVISGSINASSQAPGATVTVNLSVIPGVATGVGDAVAPGALVTLPVSVIAGAATGSTPGVAPGALVTISVTVITLAPGAADTPERTLYRPAMLRGLKLMRDGRHVPVAS